MAAAETTRALSREEFLRGTAGLAAAGTGMGLLVPSALARGQAKKGGTLHLVYTDTSAAETSDPTYQTGIYPAGTDPKKTPIGTGPFMLKSWKPTLGWQMVRNPHYWVPGLPYLDAVQAVYIADPNTKVQAVTNGSADLSDRIPFTQVNSIKQNSNLQLFTLPGAVFLDYSFDAMQAPYTDSRVIKAIKMAVNRRAVMQAAIQGQGVLTGDVPELPSDPYYPPSRGVPGPDIAGAKKLLAAAGHSSGIDITITTADVYPGIVDPVAALKSVVAPAGRHIP